MENLIGLYVWHLVVLRSRWSAVVFASLTTLLQDTEELHLLSKLPEQFIQCFASFSYLFILTRHCKIEWWTCRYFLNAGYSVIFLYRRFAFLLSSFVPCSKQFPLSFFIIKWKQYDFICRGSCQPYCSSLPDDPLLECFNISDGSNIQGLDVEYRMHI